MIIENYKIEILLSVENIQLFLVCTLLIFCDIFISFYLLMMQYSYETYVRNKILLLEISDIKDILSFFFMKPRVAFSDNCSIQTCITFPQSKALPNICFYMKVIWALTTV